MTHTEPRNAVVRRARRAMQLASVMAVLTIGATACGWPRSDETPASSDTTSTDTPTTSTDTTTPTSSSTEPSTTETAEPPSTLPPASQPSTTEANVSPSTTSELDSRRAGCRTEASGLRPVGSVPVHGEVVVDGLETPWGIGWLPDASMLITERNGSVRHVDADGTLRAEPVLRVPASESSEGGLLGIAIHPDFATNRSFYVYYSSAASNGAENVVERFTLAENSESATSAGVIVDGIPAARFHSGGRLRFGPDAKLYIGTGDATRPELSPDLDSLAGKLLRVNDDGSIPDDNPNSSSPIWLSGIRNTQGFDWRPDGAIVVTDHGPSGAPSEDGRSGHDEVTVARPGDDLGWPTVIGCDEKDGSTTPSLAWTEAVPPGGAAIYTGSEIPEWTGDLFIGVLGLEPGVGHLHRVRLDADGNATVNEAYFLDDDYGRIRDVVMGPDGALYFTTSNCDGRGDCGDGDRIIRVRPGTQNGGES